MHRAFHSYGDYRGSMDRVRKGAIISTATGVTTTYALGMLEARGTLSVGNKVDVYEGMIIGENSREETMEVNPTKEKKLTNMRGGGGRSSTCHLSSTCHSCIRSRLNWGTHTWCGLNEAYTRGGVYVQLLVVRDEIRTSEGGVAYQSWNRGGVSG